MKIRIVAISVLAICLAVFLAGCGTRSISNSGYQKSGGWYGPPFGNPYYQGELNELAVLGIDKALQPISESDIQAAMAEHETLSLQRGDSIILIQSGAMFPDGSMLNEMKPYFTVTPLSGIPERTHYEGYNSDVSQKKPAALNKVLRLTAARAGAKALIVYWGILEASKQDQVTKTVSWVPVMGSLIPDEVQNMRIRLKGVVMDVETGNWLMLNPDAIDHKRISTRFNRGSADQSQVGFLKVQAYTEFVDDLLGRFSIDR